MESGLYPKPPRYYMWIMLPMSYFMATYKLCQIEDIISFMNKSGWYYNSFHTCDSISVEGTKRLFFESKPTSNNLSEKYFYL